MGVGISGGRYGTIITVLDEDDKGGLISDPDDARSGAKFLFQTFLLKVLKMHLMLLLKVKLLLK